DCCTAAFRSYFATGFRVAVGTAVASLPPRRMRLSRTGLLSRVERDRPSGYWVPMQLRSVGSLLQRHAYSGAESGACVATRPPLDRPPSLHRLRRRCHSALFEASQVPCGRPTSHPRACPSFGSCLHGPVRSAGRTRMRSPKFRRKDISTCMGSPTARGSSSASPLRGEDVAFRPTGRRQHLGIRPVSSPWSPL